MSDLETSSLFLEVIPRTMRSIREEIRNIAGSEFTTPQYRLLARIARQPSSNTELAEWMGVSAPTMTNLVDKLVVRGLVTRGSDPKNRDRRQIQIRATQKGTDTSARIRGAVQQVFARRLAELPSARKKDLVAGLKILRELFQ